MSLSVRLSRLLKIQLKYGVIQWTISHVASGTYNIEGHKGDPNVRLSVGNDNELVCVPGGRTTWTFDPRGDAYVSALYPYCPYHSFIYQDRIGNAVDATAIHLYQHPQHVSPFMLMVDL